MKVSCLKEKGYGDKFGDIDLRLKVSIVYIVNIKFQ